LAKLSRRELKEDRLRTAFEDYEAFAKEHYQTIIAGVAIVLALVGAVYGLRVLTGRAEATANTKLAVALDTYHAYVGAASPQTVSAGMETFPTEQEKYKKALGEFQAVTDVTGVAKLLPRRKAVRLARYYVGVCQGELGNDAAAVETLEASARDSDPAIASLAKLALGEEYVKTGKVADAVKIYQDLSDHPTPTVPRSTSLLALADVYRGSQPGQARQIYERLEKEYGTDAALAGELKQQISSLPQ
jgi:tetratricopeptide (TPR) repeat protein